MAPLMQEERRAARAQKVVVQGVIPPSVIQDKHTQSSAAGPQGQSSKCPSKRHHPNTSMVVAAEVAEGHDEPEAPEPTPTPFIPPSGTWRSELTACRSGVGDPSLWDVDFPFKSVLNQVSTPGDKAKMKELGINESLQAIRSYSFWASSLANSTERLCRDQRQHYLEVLQSLEEKVATLEQRCAELEYLHSRATCKLERAELGLSTSSAKYKALEKTKSDLQSLLISTQEERDQLVARISELTSQGVADYDHGFQAALDRVHEMLPALDLGEIHPD